MLYTYITKSTNKCFSKKNMMSRHKLITKKSNRKLLIILIQIITKQVKFLNWFNYPTNNITKVHLQTLPRIF